MSRGFDLYLEFGIKRLEQLKNYKRVAREVKEIIQKFLGEVDVYVFGSVVEGEVTASSDIDILVIADNANLEVIYKLKTTINSSIDAPVELHIVSSNDFENWYKRFISKLEKVI
ncbi:MAG: nucleotidyltransferase domain-containing protein [Candidatus Caldarchaeales archaeon]